MLNVGITAYEMKTSVFVALISVCSPFASAVVHLTYAKQQRSTTRSPATGSSRRGSVNEHISYNDATYVVNVTVGTPGQAMTLELSTSSSDSFVIDARSSYCTYDPSSYGDYDDSGYADVDTTNPYCIWGSCKFDSSLVISHGVSKGCVLLFNMFGNGYHAEPFLV